MTTSTMVAGDLRLLDPEVRRSADAVTALLHEDCREFGASGSVWDRASIVAALGAGSVPEPVTTSDLRAVRLAADVILLTYVADRSGRTTLRSSLWVHGDDRWKVLFHQGTLRP